MMPVLELMKQEPPNLGGSFSLFSKCGSECLLVVDNASHTNGTNIYDDSICCKNTDIIYKKAPVLPTKQAKPELLAE